jgi:acyl carrier protein
MTVESEDYKLEVLEYAVNQSIDLLLPKSCEDALNAILDQSNEVVWRVAIDIYTKSGHQIDLLFVKNLLNLRIEPLRNKISTEERIKKAKEAEKTRIEAELEDQRQIKEAQEAKIRAKLEAERLERIAEQQGIKQENLKAFRERYPNVSIEVFLRIEKLITEELLLGEERIITIDSVLSKDLSADDLYIMELIVAVEKEFNIEIPDDFTGTNWISCICGDYSRLKSITVKEIVDIVCEKIQ